MLVVEDESSRQLVRGRRLVSTLVFGYVYAFISHAVVKKKKDHKKKTWVCTSTCEKNQMKRSPKKRIHNFGCGVGKKTSVGWFGGTKRDGIS